MANDVGPTKALSCIREVLGAQTRVTVLSGGTYDEPKGAELETLMAHTDIALIGMSSPAANAGVEIRVARTMHAAGKPFALFADTFGAWQREWFAPLRDLATSVGLHALCRLIPVVDCRVPLIDGYILRETGGWQCTPHGFGATVHTEALFLRTVLKEKWAVREPFLRQSPGVSARQIVDALLVYAR
ncbi:MAG: hypothetical protein WBK28_01155 [Minisyncoccia bacterium]